MIYKRNTSYKKYKILRGKLMVAMRKFVASHIGHPLQDRIKKTKILKKRDFLMESQFWNEDRIKEYQLKKIINLVKYAYNYVPYYHQLFKNIGFHPSDIKTLNDFKKIPVLTKDISRKENFNLIASNTNMKYVSKGKTGGTTGPPLLIYKDAKGNKIKLS